MNTKKEWKRWLPPLVMGLAIGLFLQLEGKYLFFYLEQQQLFMYNSHVIGELLNQVGGGSKLLSYFLLQFFELPYCGALITTLLLMAIAHATHRVLSGVSDGKVSWLFAWFPALLLLFILFQTDFFYQGVISYLIAVCTVWGYGLLPAKLWRYAVGGLAKWLLYLSIGSAALVVAICLTLWEVLQRKASWRLGLLYTPFALFVGFLCVYFSWIGDFGLAYTFDFYYDAISTSPIELSVLFYLLPVLMVMVKLLASQQVGVTKWKLYALTAIQLVVLGVMGNHCYAKYVKRDMMPTLELDHYVSKREWSQVTDFYRRNPGNFIYLNCFNMALARQDRLGDEMFTVPQAGPYSLLVGENNTEVVAGLLSEVNLSMGNTAAAQKMAFTSCIAAKSAVNPHQLQRLVKTHIVRRDFKVAEKYLLMLSQSLFYADWAAAYLPFAREESSVAADVELAQLRVGSFGRDHLVTPLSLKENLQSVIQIDSTNMRYVNYLGAYHLLSKDLNSFKTFIERQYRPDDEKRVPHHFQEALCAAASQDRAYLLRYGVSREVISEFEAFTKALETHRGNPAIAQFMEKQFGRTYWYYLMFIG